MSGILGLRFFYKNVKIFITKSHLQLVIFNYRMHSIVEMFQLCGGLLVMFQNFTIALFLDGKP